MKHPNQRVGIFIDTQNMYYSARYLFKRKVNFKNIIEDGSSERQLIRTLAYVVRTKTQEEQPFFDALMNLGIELREKDLQEFLSGHKKADWDVGLAIDVVRMLDMLDVVVLVTGDGDFKPLVEFCQSRGRVVELFGFGETTSSMLLEVVDDYTNLSDNKRRYLIGPVAKDTKTKPPSKSKKVKGPEPESDEEIPAPDSFFMNMDGEDDQEVSRKRRLEF